MMKLPKSKWKGLIKLLGPLLFIFFFIKVVDPQTAAKYLFETRIEIALLSLFFFPVIISVRTFRWWVICKNLEMEVFFKGLFQVYYISWFLGTLPVSGIGALSKIVYLKEEGKAIDRTVISITLDKLFDIMGLMFFGLFGIFYFPKDIVGGKILYLFYGGGAFALGLIVIFGKKVWNSLMTVLKQHTQKRLLKFGIGLEESLKQFWSGFNLKIFSLILGLSIIVGLSRSLVLYILAISLNIKVSFVLMVGCRALIGIANVIPITVGGLGTRDAILLLTLPLYGVPREAAIALGFVTFLWAMCFTFSGVVFWLKRPLPAKEMILFKNKLFPPKGRPSHDL